MISKIRLVLMGLSLGLIISGCSRDGNNPLLSTPDPAVVSFITNVVDVDSSDLKNFKVSFTATSNLALPISGLSLGNIVLQEGWNYDGLFTLDNVFGTNYVYSADEGAHPTAAGVPVSLAESSTVPGQYELVFIPRTQKKGYFSMNGYLHQMAWVTVTYGTLSSRHVVAYRTE
ncbi:MAG: hypothetical protein KBD85_03585 [Elusimicrobia bacterium]|nr:hypothetical protein [Elusimicrobiota bacterium]